MPGAKGSARCISSAFHSGERNGLLCCEPAASRCKAIIHLSLIPADSFGYLRDPHTVQSRLHLLKLQPAAAVCGHRINAHLLADGFQMDGLQDAHSGGLHQRVADR